MNKIFKLEKPQKTINGKVFNLEKIISLMFIDKDLIANFDIGELFWDDFSNAILRVKALPLVDPNFKVAYLQYNVTDLDDDDNYTIRISLTALWSRTRGRRSNQFKRDQVDALAKYKRNYIRLLSKHIKEYL